MTQQVFVDVAVTLDGYLAGPNAHPGNPMGDGAVAMHAWMFRSATFLEKIGVAGGERDTPDDRLVQQVFGRCGAYVMGRRMFDEGEVAWPENAPFNAPVFVVTHKARAPWPRLGGTTFHFVTDGFESALVQARAAAGAKDVRISGGAHTIREALVAGAVDEVTLHVSPLLLGAGNRLFDGLAPAAARLVPESAVHAPLTSHLRYRVARS